MEKLMRTSRRDVLKSTAALSGLIGTRDATGQSGSSEEYAGMPPTDEIFGWIEDLWRMGDRGKYGYRMPGTPEDHEAANYIEQKFRGFGLQAVQREPVSIQAAFPGRWSLTIQIGDKNEELPCWFVRYAAFTPPQGITGEIVYVGQGSEKEFKEKNAQTNIAGKLVLVDLISRGIRCSTYWPPNGTLFTYDPNKTLPDDMVSETWPLANVTSSIDLARRHGAIGYVGVLMDTAQNNCQEYHDAKVGNEVMSALTVSPATGDYLKKHLAAGPVKATVVLTEQPNPWRTERAGAPAFGKWGITYNIHGTLPGKTDEVIVVMSHHDGGATNEASGASMVMALAKYFARAPSEARQKTMLFLAVGSHFGLRAPILEHGRKLAAVEDRIACLFNIEMIGRQYKLVNGRYVDTGLPAPRAFGVSHGNPRLTAFVRQAIEKHRLDRSVVSDHFIGEGGPLTRFGLTVVEHLSLNAPQFSRDDTPQTVMKEALRPVACAFADVINKVGPIPRSELRNDSQR
jgi:hypothetical protein